MSRPGDGAAPGEPRLRGERGPKGEPGEPGEKGGLSPRISRALIILFLLPSLIAIAAAAGVVIQTGDYQAAQRRDQAQQARQGRIVQARLCATFDQLAALKPPAGDPAANPSRAYLQREHATLVRLGTDLGCGTSS